MKALPAYVKSRLCRQAPADTPIVSGSTPVLSFGNPMKATFATLGLNPSDLEFIDGDGLELQGRERRLETLASLVVKNLTDAPMHVLNSVVESCNGYFQRRPYRRWFDQLEIVLRECGASYYDGSACHLDLVQWATSCKWSKVWDGHRTMLLRDDVPFLIEQLENSNIHTLMLNGITVVKEFSAAAKVDLIAQPKKVRSKTTMFVGRGPKQIRVIGWSTNLQAIRGDGSAWRFDIAKAVSATLHRGGGSSARSLDRNARRN